MIKLTIDVSAVNEDEILKTIKFLESFLSKVTVAAPKEKFPNSVESIPSEVVKEVVNRQIYYSDGENIKSLPTLDKPGIGVVIDKEGDELEFKTKELNEHLSIGCYVKPKIRKVKKKTSEVSSSAYTIIEQAEVTEATTALIETEVTSEDVINHIMNLATERKITPIQVASVTKELGLSGLPDIHNNQDLIPVIMDKINELVKE